MEDVLVDEDALYAWIEIVCKEGLFTNDKINRKLPEQFSAESWSEEDVKPLQIDSKDKVSYATYLQVENYFAGLRISTLSANSKQTRDTLFESVIPYANPLECFDEDIDFSLVNKTSYGGNNH